jgi:chemotaxis response regulator CheB
LIVDDHRLVRLGLQRMLEGDASIDVIGEAENGEDAIQLTRELDPGRRPDGPPHAWASAAWRPPAA